LYTKSLTQKSLLRLAAGVIHARRPDIRNKPFPRTLGASSQWPGGMRCAFPPYVAFAVDIAFHTASDVAGMSM
jgi:hypothetical protein